MDGLALFFNGMELKVNEQMMSFNLQMSYMYGWCYTYITVHSSP